MLVNQDNGDIFPLLCEVLECLFDHGVLGLGVDYQEVALGIWGVRDVLLQEKRMC